MTVVKFYDNVADDLLKFAVIIAKYNGKFIFCKHKQRNTLEVPGGHREPNEIISDTAARELSEETGALKFDIQPICVYSVTASDNFDGKETFGMLYYAQVKALEKELHSEIEKVVILIIGHTLIYSQSCWRKQKGEVSCKLKFLLFCINRIK